MIQRIEYQRYRGYYKKDKEGRIRMIQRIE